MLALRSSTTAGSWCEWIVTNLRLYSTTSYSFAVITVDNTLFLVVPIRTLVEGGFAERTRNSD